MSRQSYSYSTEAATPRQSASHGTSSAFSSSANPDEDWTQISDLAERRRIQNRIAQRNYRKKLKRRLEDLERRAGSSSASPPPSHAELEQVTAPKKSEGYKPSHQRQKSSQSSTRQMSQSPYTSPPMQHDTHFITAYDRHASHSPPLFPYSTYPAPEDSLYSYPSQRQAYQTPGILSGDSYDYLSSVVAPPLAPLMQYSQQQIKRESMLEDSSMNPFSMSYAAMAGISIEQGKTHAYGDTNSHSPPPLSRSFSEGSEMYNYPTTPMSMPASPGKLHYM